jgi:putative ABC transport system permease protein
MRGPREDPPDWRVLVRAHFAGDAAEADPAVLDELAQHLGDLYDEAIARGSSHSEALAAARSALPSERRRLVHDVVHARRALPGVIADRWASDHAVPSAKKRVRVMADLRRDFIHASRQLWRSPGYALTVIATLALGIGGSVAIFAAVDVMLLRPLPYPGAERIVVPKSQRGDGIPGRSVSYGDYLDWNRETTVFDAVALIRTLSMDLVGAGRPERVEARAVSPEFFKVLPITPLHGRLFDPADYKPGSRLAGLVSHQFWQQVLGGAGDVVGKTVRLSGSPMTIVGILPPKIVWPENVQLFVPLRPHVYSEADKARRDNLIFTSIARLRDGVTIEQGDAVLAGIASRLAREFPESRKGWTNKLSPMRNELVQADVRRSLWMLLGAVAAVLLIGCVNLANIGLVRGIARSRELGVRAALGASRWRLVRQLVVESLLLSFVGAAAGVAIATLLMRGLIAMAPPGTALVAQMALDLRVLAGAVVVTMVAVALAGVVPALAASRVDAGAALKDGTAGAGSSRRVRALRHGMTVIEVACAVVLLCGAALLLQSYWRLQRVDPGLDLDRVLSARLSLPGAKYNTAEKAEAFFQSLVARLETLPGVESAGVTSYVPVGGGGFGLGRVFLAEGRPEPPAGTEVDSLWNVISPGYFGVMGIPLVQGRAFTAADTASSEPVAIVSKSFARKMFGETDPLGQRVRSWRDENLYRRIVGVVDEVRYNGLAEVAELRQFYVPHSQNSWGLMNVVVRSAGGDPASLETTVRKGIAALDADLAVSNVLTLRAVAGRSVADKRYAMLLLTILAVTALVLGALGIYGVVGHAVSMRAREFGIRLALGGSSGHLYGLVLGQGLALTAVGLAIGLGGAFAVSRVIESLLYETAPRHPGVYIVTAVIVLAVALIASFGPARRAAKSDPLAVLRAS